MTLYDDMMEGVIDVHCHIDFEFSAKKAQARAGVSLAAESRGDGHAGCCAEIALVADGESHRRFCLQCKRKLRCGPASH